MTTAQRLAAKSLRASITVKLDLLEHHLPRIVSLGNRLTHCLKRGRKILICGNGGSAADAQHFAAELVVRLKSKRRALPCLALTTDTSTLTACGNDFGFEEIFARQVEALGARGDLLVLLSTSGRSANILRAARSAKKRGLVTVALTGSRRNPLTRTAAFALQVPSTDTQRIQEAHITILHLWGELIERNLKRPGR